MINIIFGFLTAIFLFLSCLILTFILSALTEMQGANNTRVSLKQISNRLSDIQVSESDISYNEIARPSILDFHLQKSDIDLNDSEEGPVNKPDFDNLEEQIL